MDAEWASLFGRAERYDVSVDDVVRALNERREGSDAEE